MYEYLILLLCFAFLIFVKIYLVKYSYKRKLSFYTDPDAFAEEFIQNLNQQAARNPAIRNQYMDSKNLLEIMKLNLGRLAEMMKISEKVERNEIVELLRKISLPIALLNNKHHLNKVGLIGDLKLASNIVSPHLEMLCKARDMAKEQNGKDKDLNYVNWSMEKYYEYILSNLTPYLFPYS